MSELSILETQDHGAATTNVVIPYTPREHFATLHDRVERWLFLVAHRRAGKSVFAINDMIKAAIQNPRTDPPPRYGYVGPSFDQTKDLIWGYLKHYTSVIPGIKYSEGDLRVTFPHNGAVIALYGGAKAYERMRGLYFDGIMLDEYPLLNPAVLSRVVRPCLADYRGWCIVSGTSAGDDHFADLKRKVVNNPRWRIVSLPITDTNALDPDEVSEMCEDMSDEEYAQEMLCSFETPVVGAYYARQINNLMMEKRLTKVPHDPTCLVYTAWDLGIDDEMAIWFIQQAGREFHIINYYANSGEALDHYAKHITDQEKYMYGGHLLPHDARARELGTGKSRQEVLEALLGNVCVVPMMPVEDGISAVKNILPMCWFDEEAARGGFTGLKNYSKNRKTGRPVHNWASHPADAFRTFATGIQSVLGYGGNVVGINGALRRRKRRAV